MTTPQRLSVQTERGPLDVELSLAGPGAPTVLILHELVGRNDDIRRIARRFVANGYSAAVPDLFQGKHWLRCVWRTMQALRQGGGHTIEHIEAVLDALQEHPETGPVGVVGFCMGGGFAALLSTRRTLGAAAIFYGQPPTRDQLSQRACPTFAGFGLRDPTYGPKGERFAEDLKALDIPHDVAIYPDCGHSYMNDSGHELLNLLSRPFLAVAYHEACAEDSWERMLAFFGEHLVASPADPPPPPSGA